MEDANMLRYPLIFISTLVLMTTSAWAQPSFSLTIGNGPQFNQGYYRQNQCPPGHFYCNQHQSYCSHGRARSYNNRRGYRRFQGNRGYGFRDDFRRNRCRDDRRRVRRYRRQARRGRYCR